MFIPSRFTIWLKKFTAVLGVLALFLLNISLNSPVALAGPAGSGSGAPAEKSIPTTPDSFNLHSYLVVKDQHIAPITSYVVRFINFLALTIGSFAFLVIVIGGFTMLTSGGADEAVTKGKDMIKYALIGLVIAFSAYFITAFVQSIFFEYGG